MKIQVELDETIQNELKKFAKLYSEHYKTKSLCELGIDSLIYRSLMHCNLILEEKINEGLEVE